MPTYTHNDRTIHVIEHTIFELILSKKVATKHIMIQAKNSGSRFFIIEIEDNLIVQCAKNKHTATNSNLTNALV